MATSSSDCPVWEDREIRFDVEVEDLEVRRGEHVVDTLGEVEDTKGNNGVRGVLAVTTLRLVWHDKARHKTNLSIGLGTVLSMSIRTTASRLRGGDTQALFVLAKDAGIRYEFVFTHLVPESPRLFTTVQAVHRAYDSSRLYRELRLRCALVRDKQLFVLPLEQVYSHISGVWNLSSDQGNLGNMFITNVRVVWHAELAENFNVSIPYYQMKSVRSRPSTRFGRALVIETTQVAGAYVLGFRIDPQERLDEVHTEISNLQKVFSEEPVFGVEFEVQETPASLASLTITAPDEELEVVDDHATDVFATYYADAGDGQEDGAPVYSDELGLCIETVKDGLTLEDLWYPDFLK